MYSERILYGTRLFDDPIVIFCKRWSLFDVERCVDGVEPMHPIVEELRHEQVVWLIPSPWSAEEVWARRVYEQTVGAIKRVAPTHQVILLANTKAELANFHRMGFTGLVANQNQFADTRLFYPIYGEEKQHAAVYNARFQAYKRHHLASSIRELLLVGYTFEGAEFEMVRRDLLHAKYANECNGNWKNLSLGEVNSAINTARVGLCLSQVEGAMTASIEYLLAGLPVVTTPSRGGRDNFFDVRFTRWVDANSCDVSRAVRQLGAENLAPEEIRKETISKMKEANGQFLSSLAGILQVNEMQLAERFEREMNHRLAVPKTIEELV